MIARAVSAVLVVWTAATLAFFALDVLPGNAIASQLAQSGADASVIAERERALGLSDPAGTRYLHFLLNAVRGDLGASLLSGEPVTEAVIRSIGPTFALAISALLIACITGVMLGVLGALPVRAISFVSRNLIDLALSTPIYWTGTLAIYLVTVQFKLATGSSMALPALVLGFHTAGAIGCAASRLCAHSPRQRATRTACHWGACVTSRVPACIGHHCLAGRIFVQWNGYHGNPVRASRHWTAAAGCGDPAGLSDCVGGGGAIRADLCGCQYEC
jgi:peptide/nickel transport system permease protein